MAINNKSTKRKKSKQKPKPGKVVRLRKDLWERIQTERQSGETPSQTLERILRASESGRSFWLLPESLTAARSAEEARGFAVIQAVQQKRKEIEEPIEVREVL